MSSYDIQEKRQLGKVRKRNTGLLILITVLLIVFFWIISKFSEELTITAKNIKAFKTVCYVAIFLLFLLMFALIISITRPSYVLQNDLKNIYIVKKHNKITTVPITEIRRVRARVRSSKKSKKEYGTIVIRTTTRERHKIKNIYNVTEVKENIMLLIEKLQIYYEGVKQGRSEYEEFGINY